MIGRFIMMKVLIFGPSGSGKTYLANHFKQSGVNAWDDADIEGLSNWYDKTGNKIPAPKSAAEAAQNGYAFLWSKKTMRNFLSQFDTVYVFGGAGNVSSVFELFDKVYFLNIDEQLQRIRLQSPLRPTPLLDENNGEIVVWGKWFEQMAREKEIPFVDASQTPEEIFQVISNNETLEA